MRKKIFILTFVVLHAVIFSETSHSFGDIEITENQSSQNQPVINKPVFHNNNISFAIRHDSEDPLSLVCKRLYTDEILFNVQTEAVFFTTIFFLSEKRSILFSDLCGEIELTSNNTSFAISIKIANLTISRFSGRLTIISLPGDLFYVAVDEGRLEIHYNNNTQIMITGEGVIISDGKLLLLENVEKDVARNRLISRFYSKMKETLEIEKSLYTLFQQAVSATIARDSTQKAGRLRKNEEILLAHLFYYDNFLRYISQIKENAPLLSLPDISNHCYMSYLRFLDQEK